MAEFHGGFFVARTDAGIAAPVYHQVLTYLQHRDVALANRRISYAWRPGSPVVHAAVLGGAAEGRGAAGWHAKNRCLGGMLAHALGCDVWAYSYESQAGSEETAHFDSAGLAGEHAAERWDDFAARLGVDLDGEDAPSVERLMGALPLGALAHRLGVRRRLLELELGCDTPAVDQPLTAPLNHALLREYLAGARTRAVGAILSLPENMWDDIESAARRARCDEAMILSIAWDLGKAQLYELLQARGGQRMRPFTPRLPSGFLISRVAAEFEPSDQLAYGPLRVIRLALPARVRDELEALSELLGDSPSCLMGRVYAETRAHIWSIAQERHRGAARERG